MPWQCEAGEGVLVSGEEETAGPEVQTDLLTVGHSRDCPEQEAGRRAPEPDGVSVRCDCQPLHHHHLSHRPDVAGQRGQSSQAVLACHVPQLGAPVTGQF